MDTINPHPSAERFALLGTGAAFTRRVAAGLLERGLRPVACIQSGAAEAPLAVLPGAALEVPAASPWLAGMRRAGCRVAFEREIPDLAGWLRELELDVLLIACWPRRLPQAVLDAPRRAALNLHPSLLPAWPGRDPVGDQLRAGERQYGITLHRMTGVIDGGPVIAQQAFTLPETEHSAIEARAASLGARLFADWINPNIS